MTVLPYHRREASAGFAQAQGRARQWFKRRARGDALDDDDEGGPYTVDRALADYRIDYLPWWDGCRSR